MSSEESPVVPDTIRLQVPGGQVEEVPLEEYVKGVVPGYLGRSAPPEALKALAIAIRSEAAVLRRHARDGFDLCPTAHCLVWDASQRYTASDQAVDWTAGQVIAANGRVLSAPFFEHCDGLTRDGREQGSGALDHCRAVACRCGNSQLSGHGVGLCQHGALAMARSGAAAQEILNHYYAHVAIVRATARGRGELRQSLIFGRVVNRAGQPESDLRLVLSGSAGTFQRASDAGGRFWFGSLPAGRWTLRVKGRSGGLTALSTDGRNSAEATVILGTLPRLAMTVVPMAHPQQLVGTLGYDNVPVTVIDPTGKQQTVVSGSAPEFNPGGFALPLPPQGRCTLQVEDQAFGFEVTDLGVWVRFSPAPG